MCGILSIFNHQHAVSLALRGLGYVEHRGPQGAGLVGFENGICSSMNGTGPVAEVLRPDDVVLRIRGRKVVGHTRYATNLDHNAFQPFLAETDIGHIAIAHNGNIPFAESERDDLIRNHGRIFHSGSDTEVILHRVVMSKAPNLVEKIQEGLKDQAGAFSVVILTDQEMVGFRDNRGFRPLILGILDGCYVFASETCALDTIGAEVIREVKPGEIIRVTDKGIECFTFGTPQLRSMCLFESLYFARPDSLAFYADHPARANDAIRFDLGIELARVMSHIHFDFVCAVPDSGNASATGFAFRSGVPLRQFIVRNHSAGRTFLAKDDASRENRLRVKFNMVPGLADGKSIGVVDDSVVRGKTSQTLFRQMWKMKPKEIHLLIPCPTIIAPCHHGIDMSTYRELLATGRTLDEMRKEIGVTSLTFLPLEDVVRIAGGDGYCTGCFSGKYPEPVPRAA